MYKSFTSRGSEILMRDVKGELYPNDKKTMFFQEDL